MAISNYTERIKAVLLKGAQEIAEQIRTEATEQGHVNTGKLVNSIKAGVQAKAGTIEGYVKLLRRYIYVEYGVSAENIPFSGVRRTGRKRIRGRKGASGASTQIKSKYIQGLITFFKNLGKPFKAAKSAAFATAFKQKEEGMPTVGSYSPNISNNRRRLRFLQHTVQTTETINDVKLDLLSVVKQEYTDMLNEFKQGLN